MRKQQVARKSSPSRASLLILATCIVTPAIWPSDQAKAEDSGNVYGFMRSEWAKRPQQPQQQRSFFAPFSAPRAAPSPSHYYRPRYANLPPAAIPTSYDRPLSFSVKPRRSRSQFGRSHHVNFVEEDVVQAKIKGEVTYCVRLCDGFFVPLTYSSSASTDKATKTCAESWPAAETAIYKSSDVAAGIEAARAPKSGELYSALPTAYAYRNQGGGAENTCTPAQLAEKQHDIWDDPTLKKGDIFVSEEGAVVFSGRGGPPYEPKDFSPVTKAYSKLNKDVRLLVEAIKSTGGAQAAPTPSSTGTIPAPSR